MTDTFLTPVALAVSIYAGRAAVPTAEALRLAGIPGTSTQYLCARRRDGKLPVRELRIGTRYYVTAAAYAEAFLGGQPPAESVVDGASNPAPRRRGRPRKALTGQAAGDLEVRHG